MLLLKAKSPGRGGTRQDHYRQPQKMWEAALNCQWLPCGIWTQNVYVFKWKLKSGFLCDLCWHLHFGKCLKLKPKQTVKLWTLDNKHTVNTFLFWWFFCPFFLYVFHIDSINWLLFKLILLEYSSNYVKVLVLFVHNLKQM